MTTGYSEEEVQRAVASLVRTSARRPVDALGVQKTSVTFSDVQEAASGLFLFSPVAPLYVLKLGAARLLSLVEKEAQLLAQVEEAARSLGRRVTPVADVTSLVNARTALFELQGAVGGKGSALRSLETAPAYQRFASNVDRFLTEYGDNVRHGGRVAPTPQEARARLQELLPQVTQAHTEVRRLAGLLAGALEDYASVNLPALAASGAVGRSREMMARIVDLLGPQDPTQRLEYLRDVVLALLSTKAVLREVGGFRGPGPFFPLAGQGAVYADTAHPAAPAVLRADKPSPYAVQGTPLLSVAVDGKAPVSLRLRDALYAQAHGALTHAFQPKKEILGTASGPFVFDADEELHLYVFVPEEGYVPVHVSFAPGASLTASQVALEVNAAFAAGGVGALYEADALGEQLRLRGTADNTKLVVGGGAANRPLGLTRSGGYVFKQDSAASIRGRASGPFSVPAATTLQLHLLHPATQQMVYLEVALPSGGAVSAAQVATAVADRLSSAGLAAYYAAEAVSDRLRVRATEPGPHLRIVVGGGNANGLLGLHAGEQSEGTQDNRSLVVEVPGAAGSPFSVTLDEGTFSAEEVAAQLAAALGPEFHVEATGAEDTQTVSLRFQGSAPPPFSARLRILSPSPAADVLGFVREVEHLARPSTAQQVAQDLNELAVGVTASFVVEGTELFARTDPADPTRVVVYSLREHAQASSPAPDTLQLVFPSPVEEVVRVGDWVAVREGVNAATLWQVTKVQASTVQAAGTGTPAAGSCLVEVGPDVGATYGWALQVGAGVQRGLYRVQRQEALPLEYVLDTPLPVFRTSAGQPLFFSAVLGQEYLVLSSKDASAASSLEVSGPAASLFFEEVPAKAVGRTPWFRLPSLVRGLAPGDLLEVYEDGATRTSYEIVAVDGLTIRVQPDLPLSFAPISLSVDATARFARLRSRAFRQAEVMQEGLQLWLSRPATQPGQLRELGRLSNALLVGSNPTTAQVEDVVRHVTQMQESLLEQEGGAAALEAILRAYDVPRVAAVDELIRAFREKGSGRAIDILLEGRFREFFSLEVHEASYAGAVLGQLREIARQDMPVRKVGRSSSSPEVLASFPSTDFEYDTSDADRVLTPDAPSALEQVGYSPDSV